EAGERAVEVRRPDQPALGDVAHELVERGHARGPQGFGRRCAARSRRAARPVIANRGEGGVPERGEATGHGRGGGVGETGASSGGDVARITWMTRQVMLSLESAARARSFKDRAARWGSSEPAKTRTISASRTTPVSPSLAKRNRSSAWTSSTRTSSGPPRASLLPRYRYKMFLNLWLASSSLEMVPASTRASASEWSLVSCSNWPLRRR